MKRLHVHVAVHDLQQSIRFYSALFAAEPVVKKHDYAKWMLEDPRVNFAISTRAGRVTGIDHLGIQAENGAELEALGVRLAQADVAVTAQKGASCCYAKSDKYWTLDPQGIPWESFHTLDSVPLYGSDRKEPSMTACCAPAAGEVMRNVLFLCTANSARSILAEAYLTAAGKGRFRAYSAGSHPTGAVNPFALELLRKNRLPTDGLRSKSWDEFAAAGAPVFHFVFTVCDQAAGEMCPVWPGQPMTAHWGINDPAAVTGDDEARRKAFFRAYTELSTRISLFLHLPIDKLDRLTLKKKLDDIGRVSAAAKSA